MEIEDWRPVATMETLRQRARLLADIRDFFAARKVLEVETPLLSQAMNPDPAIDSFATQCRVPGRKHEITMWLHTSPEFPMKRLLAAGSGSIYQLCRVFRNGESGRVHNPEFSMLEWYRTGFDLQQMMDEVAELIQGVLSPSVTLLPGRQRTYQGVFMDTLGLDPLTAREDQLARCASHHGIHIQTGMSRDEWLDLLMTHLIEPRLQTNRMEFIYDYPESQAALARIKPGQGVAERFELYLNGMELANGFHELADASEQGDRFRHDNRQRDRAGKCVAPQDTRFLQALAAGLPDCSGVALGVDRLLMLLLDLQHIDKVMAFPIATA